MMKNNHDLKSMFSSPLAACIVDFIELQRVCGYKYEGTTLGLYRRLDRFLVENKLSRKVLPQTLVEQWIKRKAHETVSNQLLRVGTIRKLAQYLIEHDINAYYPSTYSLPTAAKKTFIPYIFTREQIARLFKVADEMPFQEKNYPHLFGFPIILRLLYSCGLRVGEVSRLQFRDVDMAKKTLMIRESKGSKDRLVVMSPQMTRYLKKHLDRWSSKYSKSPVFVGFSGGVYSPKSIYHRFRETLFPAGISHGGKGKGPRLHDLRHTFAVHNLEKWLKAKADMNMNLSILADYLGHSSLNVTQHYLQLMPSIYPEIVSRMEKSVGKKIKRYQNETN